MPGVIPEIMPSMKPNNIDMRRSRMEISMEHTKLCVLFKNIMLPDVIIMYVRIAVTKLEEKAKDLPELFRRYGHTAVIVSTMRAAQPTDPEPLAHLAQMILEDKIDILIFTSSLGVEKLF